MIIRQARPGDEEGMARVHVQSWQTTYAGLLDERYLAGLSVDDRKEAWAKQLNHAEASRHILVLENEQLQIVGFISGGVNRENVAPAKQYDCEIYALYLLQSVQGMGWGKKMLNRIFHQLLDEGQRSAIVWALQGNKAIEFYEHTGAVHLLEKPIKIGGKVCMEVALIWEDMKRII